eukprot:scaffold103499_cov28-Prasinocladus_malaysianus.AAC.4
MHLSKNDTSLSLRSTQKIFKTFVTAQSLIPIDHVVGQYLFNQMTSVLFTALMKTGLHISTLRMSIIELG